MTPAEAFRARVETGLAAMGSDTRPRCVQRTGRECRDCVECLSAHPAGRTCNDCAFAATCKAMFGVRGDERFCDFYPSRAHFPAPRPEFTDCPF